MLSAASIAKPDITLLLDTDPSTIALRLQERVSAGSDDKADRIRVEQVERLNAAYMTLLDNQHLHSSVLGFMHLIKPDVNVMMDYLNEIFGLAKPSDDFQVSENTVRGEVCAKLKSMIKSGATGFLSADIAPVEVNNLYEDPITEFLSSANIRTLAELKARLDSLSLPQLLKIAYIKYIHIEEVDTAGGLSKSTLHIGRWLYVQLCMYTSLPDHGVDVVMRRDLKSSICSTAAMFLSALRIPMDLPYSQAVFAPRFCDAQSTYVIFNNLRLSMVDFSVCTYLNEESNLVTLLVKTVGMA
jgi:hypothetical protein